MVTEQTTETPPVPDVSEGRRLLTEAAEEPWVQEPNTHAGRVWVQRAPLHHGKDCEPLFAFRDLGTKRNDDERLEAYRQREADASLIVWLRNNAAALLDAAEAVARVEAERDKALLIGVDAERRERRLIGRLAALADEWEGRNLPSYYIAELRRALEGGVPGE